MQRFFCRLVLLRVFTKASRSSEICINVKVFSYFPVVFCSCCLASRDWVKLLSAMFNGFLPLWWKRQRSIFLTFFCDDWLCLFLFSLFAFILRCMRSTAEFITIFFAKMIFFLSSLFSMNYIRIILCTKFFFSLELWKLFSAHKVTSKATHRNHIVVDMHRGCCWIVYWVRKRKYCSSENRSAKKTNCKSNKKSSV